MLTLLTGPRGAGKTTTCLYLARIARARGWRASGLISPGRFAHHRKIGIDLLDVGGGQRRPLASLRAREEKEGIKWHFDPAILAWGADILRRATPCDLLFIDEIGPLELIQNAGWHIALDVIDQGDYHHAIVVVRPELLSRARKRWPQAQVLEVSSLLPTSSLVAMLAITPQPWD